MTFDYRGAIAPSPSTAVHPPNCVPSAPPAQGPLRFLPRADIERCQTFRDACVLAWKNRAVPTMTETYLAMICGLTQQHVSDYFQPTERDEKGRKRRQLPADKIGLVQRALGNGAIGQWIARDMALRLVEEFFAAEQR